MKNLRNIDLNLLPVLEVLLEEESVTRSAERLNLSAAAVSRSLGRLRETLDDELLTRAGRGLKMTDFARALRPKIAEAMRANELVFSEDMAFDPAEIAGELVVRATDHFLHLAGAELARKFASSAPHGTLVFQWNRDSDALDLRDGSLDLAVGVFHQVVPEMRRRRLFDDRFVCVTAAGDRRFDEGMTLEKYVSARHIQVAPRGSVGGRLDRELAAMGYQRHVSLAVPYFGEAFFMAARTDLVLTVSERLVDSYSSIVEVEVHDLPWSTEPYEISMVWHPAQDKSAKNRWLRNLVLESST